MAQLITEDIEAYTIALYHQSENILAQIMQQIRMRIMLSVKLAPTQCLKSFKLLLVFSMIIDAYSSERRECNFFRWTF